MCKPTNEESESQPRSIVIVGGGPAGLALAAHLLNHGIACKVLERRSRKDLLADTNSFYDMSSSGIQALLRIADGSAAQPIFDLAVAYDKIAFYNTSSYQSEPLANIEWKSRSLGMPMFNVTRAAMLQSLVETVEKIDSECIRFETNARLLDHNEGTVEVEGPSWGNSKQTLQADLVIGADGVHSRIRKHVFGDTGLRSDGIIACYAVLPPLTEEEAKIISKPAGLGDNYGIMGMSAATMEYAVVSKRATIWYANFILDGTPYVGLPPIPPGSDGWLDVSRDRCKGGIPVMDALIARTKEEDMQVVMCFDRSPLDSYSKGRVVLVGDAAHPFTPFAGLGSSQALVDAFCLAEALMDKSNDTAAAVAKYEEQRIEAANFLMEESRAICSTSWTWKFTFKVFDWLIRLGRIFGFHESIVDTFMTIDGNSLVNDLVPFKDEKEKQEYESRYKAALKSLKSQL